MKKYSESKVYVNKDIIYEKFAQSETDKIITSH